MLIIIGGVVTLFVSFALLDTVIPARKQTQVALWRTRGLMGFFLYYAIAFYAPVLWDGLLAEHTLFNAASLPFWAQFGIGFFVFEALVYAWHRTMHAITPIWRHVHQTHHSAERVDIWGAFWFHPLDMIGWAFVGSLALVGGVGVDVPAAITINLIGSFCAMFQHSNLSTPKWLGYVVMRPESHAVHHERGVHGYNYGDVPWFDMLFGTFRNPERAPSEAGFFDGASNRIWSLLIGRKLA